MARRQDALWGSDWFARTLSNFLARDDALRLAVWASVNAHLSSLRRVLVALHGPLAPIAARDLVVCAARDGDWRAVCALQRRCKPMSQRRRARQCGGRLGETVGAIEAAGGVVSRSLQLAMRLQRCHPVQLPPDVLYSAAQRGCLAEVAWLVDVVVAFDPQEAIECAARGGHARVVQWLLDAATRPTKDDDDQQTQGPAPEHGRKRTFHCEICLEDAVLSDVGVIVWREEPRNVAYCYVDGHGLLPRHREFRWARGYPLMDWAAEQGDVVLLARLAEHPVASASLSAIGLHRAAAHGHLHVLQWLWRHSESTARASLPQVMAEAAKRGDMAMLEWALGRVVHKASLGSLTSVFDAACLAGRVQVVEWTFRQCLDERIRPRYLLMMAAGAGHLDVVKYLHEEQDYIIVGSTVARAVEHGHLEVARWLYGRCSARLSDQDKAMFVPIAVKCGKLAVLKWLVEDLGLQSDQAIENAAWAVGDERVRVLEFLWAHNQANLRDSLARVSLVRLIILGRFDVVQWIVQHVPESDDSPVPSSDAVWFTAFLRSCEHAAYLRSVSAAEMPQNNSNASSESQTKAVIDMMLRARPRFCRQIRRFPVWAARTGDLSTLKTLEAIEHPHLFSDAVLNTILKYSRRQALMLWFLQRRALSSEQSTRVARWAAQYCGIAVLQLVLESIRSNASATFVVNQAAAWHGARCDHSEVLQQVQKYNARSISAGGEPSGFRFRDGAILPAPTS